jgi:hypothetical protein
VKKLLIVAACGTSLLLAGGYICYDAGLFNGFLPAPPKTEPADTTTNQMADAKDPEVPAATDSAATLPPRPSSSGDGLPHN